ncbi:glycosyltransferase [Allostreptomyces psammosilenae]|uniref:Glycosyltransferase involved in cell wall biosynthesis n=1 Tax=Allostreptomyces psammosilenae TaxID=1892865 RepID=A0A853AA20_9ACTN|nr:glycosyltransferase [Allostreptomyces psammosilenae]NYI07471.1 glycosyltransferase involved in cell wall biosynthesis [Allostreptomyces psammosilenae]
MPEPATTTARAPGGVPHGDGTRRLRGPGGRRLRVAHLTTVDMSLHLLLGTELSVDVASGLEVYGLSAPGRYVPLIEERGVTHVPLRRLTRAWDPAADAAAAAELLAALRRLRLDVLHTHNPKTGVLGRLLGRAAGVPVVVNTCHGLWLRPGDGAARRGLVLGAETLAGRVSHAELYQNGADRERLAWAVPRARSRVAGNGVDLDRFRPDPAARRAVRARLGVRDGELLVGGVGRRVAEKGVPEYVAAAARLAGDRRGGPGEGAGPAVHFVWAGPEDPDKPDAVPAAGAAGPVRWLGEWRDMPAFYSALDVFVLPSHREGFSRSAMEAAACGLPMVLSDIRGCREIGRHERELLLTPPGDAERLAGAVDRLLRRPELRARLGRAARERAAREFDQRRVARLSLDTYAAVARRRGLGWTG